MANFAQLYGSYLDIELGSADRTALFTTARRKDAVLRAELEFAKQTECFTKSVSVALAQDVREYDLESAISAGDFLWFAKDGLEYTFTDADGNVTYRSGEDFPRRDLVDLNANEPGWRNADSTPLPDGYYLREDGGSTYLGLKTPQDFGDPAESAAITVPYVAAPPGMSADSDQPFSASVGSNPKTILRPWHQALVHYAAALLEPLRKNYAGEQRQRQLFASHVADYLQRKRKKGGSRVVMARDYRAEARGGAVPRSQRDWRTWP